MSNIRKVLVEMLQSANPDFVFDISGIKRVYDSDVTHWKAEGKKYKSFLKYDLYFFYGQDTMSACAKSGIVVKPISEKHFEVYPKN